MIAPILVNSEIDHVKLSCLTQATSENCNFQSLGLIPKGSLALFFENCFLLPRQFANRSIVIRILSNSTSSQKQGEEVVGEPPSLKRSLDMFIELAVRKMSQRPVNSIGC